MPTVNRKSGMDWSWPAAPFAGIPTGEPLEPEGVGKSSLDVGMVKALLLPPKALTAEARVLEVRPAVVSSVVRDGICDVSSPAIDDVVLGSVGTDAGDCVPIMTLVSACL